MSEQNNVLQLKKLVAKMTNKTVNEISGVTIADVLDQVQDNYSGSGSSNIKYIDFNVENVTADMWSQSTDGMYYYDDKTYAQLGLTNITPLALTCTDWNGLPLPFLACMMSSGIDITCDEPMEFERIKLRLVYIQN